MSRAKQETPDFESHVAACLTCGTIASTFSEPCESPVATRFPPRLLRLLHDVAARTDLPIEEVFVGLLGAGAHAIDEGGEDERLDGVRLLRRLAGERDGAERLAGDPPAPTSNVIPLRSSPE